MRIDRENDWKQGTERHLRIRRFFDELKIQKSLMLILQQFDQNDLLKLQYFLRSTSSNMVSEQITNLPG